MANYFMPSEVARLILGYLIERGLQKTLTTFLQECSDFAEFYQLMKSGKVPPTTVLGQSLVDILNEFAHLKLKAVRSGHLTVQPTVITECSNEEANTIVQSRQRAEDAIKCQRLSWKERKARSRAQAKKVRETRSAAIEAQVNVSISRSASKEVSLSENISIATLNHTTNPVSASTVPVDPAAFDTGVENISIATLNHTTNPVSASTVPVDPAAFDTGVEDVPSVTVGGDQPGEGCVLLPEAAETKVSTGAIKETGAKQSSQDPATNMRSDDENYDYLNWILEDTHFHEKLAENINKALHGCDVDGKVTGDIQEATSSLEKDKVDKCSEIQNNNELTNIVNKGFNINQIIEMTASDPSFQNFLQLFQQGTAVPICPFDVPVVTLSSELPSQSYNVSVSAPNKEAKSQCSSLSHKDLSVEQASFENSVSKVLPSGQSVPESTEEEHAKINHISLHNHDNPGSSVTDDELAVTNSHILQSHSSQYSPSTYACPEKEPLKIAPVVPDENSLTVFSLIEKSAAEMNGEQFVHRSLRNLPFSQSVSATSFSDCDNTKSKNDNLLTSLSAITNILPQRIQTSSLTSENNNLRCGNQTCLEVSSHCMAADTVVSLDDNGARTVSGCEDINAKKNSGEDNTEQVFQDRKMTIVTNSFSKSVSSSPGVSSALCVAVTFPEIQMKDTCESSPLPDSVDRTPYLNTIQPVWIPKSVDTKNHSQEETNKQRLPTNNQHFDDRFDITSTLQNNDELNKDRQNLVDSIQDTMSSNAAVIHIEKVDHHKVRLFPERQERAVISSNHVILKHSISNVGQTQTFTTTESSAVLPDAREAILSPQNDHNSPIRNEKNHCNPVIKSPCTEKETLLSRNVDNCSTSCPGDSSMSRFPGKNSLIIPDKKDSARNGITFGKDLKSCASESLTKSPVKEKVNQSIVAKCSHISKNPYTVRSQSMNDCSFSKFSHKPHQTSPVRTNILMRHIGSSQYCPVEATHSNSPQKISAGRNSHISCCSLPATFGDDVPCRPLFSKSPNMNTKSCLRHTHPRTDTNKDQLLVSSSEECQLQSKTIKRRVIAVHSDYAPLIPDHYKKNPSRRIVPKEVDYSTPSPLQDFPSSPKNYVIDLPLSQPSSPFSPRESLSRQLSVGKSQTSPNKHTKVSSYKTVRAPSHHDTSNSLCKAQSQPCKEQLENTGFITSPLAKLGVNLPLSPSRRKPRRVKPIQLSSAVDKGWSSLIKPSPSLTQDASPVIDDAKIVSSTSDVFTSTEAEAFRMLKSFLASSYSKPQPRQEITSTDQKAIVTSNTTFKHHKGRVRKSVVVDDRSLGKDHHEDAGEATPRNIEVDELAECSSIRESEYRTESVVSDVLSVNRTFRTDESRSKIEHQGDGLHHHIDDVLIKNSINKEVYSDPCMHPLADPSDLVDSGKSFAVVGVVEYYPKEHDNSVKGIENCRMDVSTGVNQILVCDNLQSVPSIDEPINLALDQSRNKFFTSKHLISNPNNNSGNEVLNKTLEGTSESKRLGNENVRQKTAVTEEKSLGLKVLPISLESPGKSTDVASVHLVQKKCIHDASSAEKLINIGIGNTGDTVDETQTRASPTLSASSCEAINLTHTSSYSSNSKKNSALFSPSLPGKPASNRDKDTPTFLTQEGTKISMLKHDNSADSLLHSNVKQTSEGHQQLDNTSLTDAQNQLSNDSAADAINSSNSLASDVAGKTVLTETVTRDGVPLLDENSIFSTLRSCMAPTFDDLSMNNNSMPFLSTSSIHFRKPCVGPYTALLKAPITSSDIGLTGCISGSLRLAYNIEHPSEGEASSVSSPVKHSNNNLLREGSQVLDKDLCEGNISNVGWRPASPSNRSLLSTAMLKCGISFEGSNLITPQTFNEKDHSIWHEEPVTNVQTPGCSISANYSIKKSEIKLGRKSRSKVRKPNYRNVVNILPSLGSRNWNTKNKNTEQKLPQSHNYPNILPKSSEIQNTTLDTSARDTTQGTNKLLCQIQLIPSINGTIIVIPPGHEETFQKLLTDCEGTSQINLAQSSTDSKLPSSTQCTPHNNMKISQECYSESSLTISCHTFHPNSPQASPTVSQSEQVTYPLHNETIDSTVEKNSERNPSSLNLSDLSTESDCEITANNSDLHSLNEKERKSPSLPQQELEQFPRASKTKCVRKIAVRRRIDFTVCKKRNRKTKPERNISDRSVGSAKSSDCLTVAHVGSSEDRLTEPPDDCLTVVHVGSGEDRHTERSDDYSTIVHIASSEDRLTEPPDDCSTIAHVASVEDRRTEPPDDCLSVAPIVISKGKHRKPPSNRLTVTPSTSSKHKHRKPPSNRLTVTPSTSSKHKHRKPPSDCSTVKPIVKKQSHACSQSPNIKLYHQNMENNVQSIKHHDVLSDMTEKKGGETSKQRKLRSSEQKIKKQKDVEVSIQESVAKSSSKISNDDLTNRHRSGRIKKTGTRSTVGHISLSGLLNLNTSPKKHKRKGNKMKDKVERNIWNMYENTSEDSTTVLFVENSKHMLQCNQANSSKLTSVTKKMNKGLSTTADDTQNFRTGNKVLSPSKNQHKNSEFDSNNTQASSILSKNKNRKWKQIDRAGSPRLTKIRRLNPSGEVNKHMSTNKKSVRMVVDYSSGEIIQVITVQNNSLHGIITSEAEQAKVRPDIVESTACKKKLLKVGKKNCKLAITQNSMRDDLDIECEKSHSPKLKFTLNASSSQSRDKVCQYVGYMPIDSFQSIFKSACSQGNEQTSQPVCIQTDKTQGRTDGDGHIQHSITDELHGHSSTSNRRIRGALSLNRVNKREKLSNVPKKLEVQNKRKINLKTINTTTQNSENITSASLDCVSLKSHDNETESAVASLELCMKEESNERVYCHNEHIQHFNQKSSINHLSCPLNLLQKDVLPVHHQPIACSPSQYYSSINVSPAKLHLPPKKRLSSDFIVNDKADSQCSGEDNSPIISESVSEVLNKKATCSSHFETSCAVLQSVTELHVPLSQSDVMQPDRQESAYCTPPSDPHSTCVINPLQATPARDNSEPLLDKELLSVSETPSVQPSNNSSPCDSSTHNNLLPEITLEQLPSPSCFSLHFQHKQRSSTSSSSVISDRQDGHTHGNDNLTNDKLLLGHSSPNVQCLSTPTNQIHASSRLKESKVNKLLKKLHRKKKM